MHGGQGGGEDTSVDSVSPSVSSFFVPANYLVDGCEVNEGMAALFTVVVALK